MFVDPVEGEIRSTTCSAPRHPTRLPLPRVRIGQRSTAYHHIDRRAGWTRPAETRHQIPVGPINSTPIETGPRTHNGRPCGNRPRSARPRPSPMRGESRNPTIPREPVLTLFTATAEGATGNSPPRTEDGEIRPQCHNAGRYATRLVHGASHGAPGRGLRHGGYPW